MTGGDANIRSHNCANGAFRRNAVNLRYYGVTYRRKVIIQHRGVANGYTVHRDRISIIDINRAGDGDGIDLGDILISAHVRYRRRY